MSTSAYADDPRVTPTTRGVSFAFRDLQLFIHRTSDPAADGWDIVDADSVQHGFSEGSLDQAIAFFLGAPQTADSNLATAS